LGARSEQLTIAMKVEMRFALKYLDFLTPPSSGVSQPHKKATIALDGFAKDHHKPSEISNICGKNRNVESRKFTFSRQTRLSRYRALRINHQVEPRNMSESDIIFYCLFAP
jgi:hypothetical protein